MSPYSGESIFTSTPPVPVYVHQGYRIPFRFQGVGYPSIPPMGTMGRFSSPNTDSSVPSCTYEGSGLGRSVADNKKTCPRSTILNGLAVKGSDERNAQDSVSVWLREIGMKK